MLADRIRMSKSSIKYTMPTGGLIAWFDSSQADTMTLIGTTTLRVSKWGDASGNTNDATQNNQTDQPIFYDGVVFNGTSRNLVIGNKLNMGLKDMTIFVVMKTLSAKEEFIFSKAIASNTNYRYGVGINNGKASLLMIGDSGMAINPTGGITINDNSTKIVAYEFDRNNNASIYVNGVLDVSAVISNMKNTNMISSDIARIGSYTAANNIDPILAFNGGIMEIIMYDRVAPPNERKIVERYLSNKWGVVI